MGMSVATLRRRLAEEGSSFRAVADALRRDAAQILLMSGRPTQDIAEELGLSDSRCFRRACHTWFGASPSKVRESLRSRP
jgi:AraC-like DNA-binding protein